MLDQCPASRAVPALIAGVAALCTSKPGPQRARPSPHEASCLRPGPPSPPRLRSPCCCCCRHSSFLFRAFQPSASRQHPAAGRSPPAPAEPPRCGGLGLGATRNGRHSELQVLSQSAAAWRAAPRPPPRRGMGESTGGPGGPGPYERGSARAPSPLAAAARALSRRRPEIRVQKRRLVRVREYPSLSESLYPLSESVRVALSGSARRGRSARLG